MELYIGPRGWILPALYPIDLSMDLLLRSNHINHSIHINTSPSMTISNTLPILHPSLSSSHYPSGLHSIIQYLRSHSLIDSHLTTLQVSESNAYSSYILNTLESIVNYELFLIDSNFHTITNPLLKHTQTFPISFMNPIRTRYRIRSELQHLINDDMKLQETYDQVRVVLNSINIRLGTQSLSFYGGNQNQSVSSLDAIVFGLLANCLYSDLKESRLREIVSEFRNLVELCHSLRSRFYQECHECFDGSVEHVLEKSATERITKERAEKSGNQRRRDVEVKDEKVVARKRRNQMFIVVCVLSFGLYALELIEFDSLTIQ
mmetsp:Transcript_11592/g.20964  ORF Transcript_11592/g.20964 Transcript_11592/m.20964 type:complete len:319 (-) Transcript_11592:2010-2966(-)